MTPTTLAKDIAEDITESICKATACKATTAKATH
jgi:hypothetical protein